MQDETIVQAIKEDREDREEKIVAFREVKP